MNSTYSVTFVCVLGGLLKSASTSKSLSVRWVQPDLLIVLHSVIQEACAVDHDRSVWRFHAKAIGANGFKLQTGPLEAWHTAPNRHFRGAGSIVDGHSNRTHEYLPFCPRVPVGTRQAGCHSPTANCRRNYRLPNANPRESFSRPRKQSAAKKGEAPEVSPCLSPNLSLS